jgi:hypothetical protein
MSCTKIENPKSLGSGRTPSVFWSRRSPPEMPVIRCVAGTICHRKNHPGADGPSKLDRLLDLLVSRS